MPTAGDVYAVLITYGDTEGFSRELLTAESEKGLAWVKKRLKEGVCESDPLIAETAAAIAHWFFFIKKLSDTDKYGTYKAGDLTVSRDLQKELKLEKTARDEALAAAAEILKDGGFYFSGH